MSGRIIKTNSTSNLPVIGKIKIGQKSDKGFPQSLDYFIPKGKYELYFNSIFKDKPNKIQIIFASDAMKDVCNERYELRDKQGKLYGSGDGEKFSIWNGKEYKEFLLAKHPDLLERSASASESPKGWEVVLTLRFMIPAIRGIFGQWELSTKGKASSVNAIRDTFDFVQERAGTVTKIVFDLTVEKVKSQKPGTPSVYPVINLIPNISEQNLTLVKGFIESNKNITMITDETLEKVKQIEAPKPSERDKEELPFK